MQPRSAEPWRVLSWGHRIKNRKANPPLRHTPRPLAASPKTSATAHRADRRHSRPPHPNVNSAAPPSPSAPQARHAHTIEAMGAIHGPPINHPSMARLPGAILTLTPPEPQRGSAMQPRSAEPWRVLSWGHHLKSREANPPLRHTPRPPAASTKNLRNCPPERTANTPCSPHPNNHSAAPPSPSAPQARSADTIVAVGASHGPRINHPLAKAQNKWLTARLHSDQVQTQLPEQRYLTHR
jgi:hypothetical protein